MKYKGHVVDAAFIFAVDAKLKEFSGEDLFMQGSIHCTLAAAEMVWQELHEGCRCAVIDKEMQGRIKNVILRFESGDPNVTKHAVEIIKRIGCEQNEN